MVAEVIINRNAKKLNRVFDYKIPIDLQDLIFIGSKVLVPFGKNGKLEEGFVVKIKEKSEFEIKEIVKVENDLNQENIKLAKWMSKRYFCNISDCINLMLTPGTKKKNKKVGDKKINVVYLAKNENEIKSDIENKKIKSEKQKNILNFVIQNQGTTIPKIEEKTDGSRGIVNTLVKNGYLKIVEEKIERDPLKFKNIEKTNFLKLTDEQKNAYEKIAEAMNNNEFKEFLLFGVTGSRKN